jgi:hypothetical protein
VAKFYTVVPMFVGAQDVVCFLLPSGSRLFEVARRFLENL